MKIIANEKLFNEISSIGYKIDNLKGIVQNDMDITEEDIEDWEILFNKLQDELKVWRIKVGNYIVSCNRTE